MSPLQRHISSLPPSERQERTQVISHELRTPLAIIRGYAQLIAEESEDGMVHLTQPLLDAVDRLGRVVDALVDFEEEPVQPSTEIASESRIPMDHWIDRISRQVVARHADCTVELVLDLASDLSMPCATADVLSRAVKAILDNAIRFTGEGSVLIRSRKVDDQLELRILDEGPGFPQGPVSLTGAFHQGSRGMNRRHGGLGLGLHAAKKAISALNGSMQLQSRRDRSGASVMMRVPFTPANATLRSVSSPQDTSSLRRAA